MFQALNNIYKLLDKNRKLNLIIIQLLVIFSAIAELAQVIVLAGFMNFISNYSEALQESSFLKLFSEVFSIQGNDELLLYIAVACLIFLLMCTCFSLFALWMYQLFGQKIGADLSNRLYVYYMKKDWLFHTLRNSSSLSSNIAVECVRVSSGIISQFLHLNSRLIMAFTMTVAIFIYDFFAAVLITLIFSTTYLVIYLIVEQRMIKNGQIMTEVNARKFKLMNEGFGGIRDTILLGRSNYFSKSFVNQNKELVRVNSQNATLSHGPRYITELAAFGTLIIVVIYSTIYSEASLNTVLPLLSFFALAGFKLLPAFQQIYYSFSTMQGNIAALNGLEDDLKNSSPIIISELEPNQDKEVLSLKTSISIKNLSFKYPGEDSMTINDVSFEINANSKIGFVGHSGSGKSTMADILTGLLRPSKGSITIDGEELTSKNIRKWQNNIGFVSQRVFLNDASIKQNIAFGLPEHEINITKVNEALEKSNLLSFVSSLKEGIDTIVGERGVQLSGGQCQRIGIARALYENCSLLIFDEASSSLDGITEKRIMEEIGKLSSFKTIIIIAHRINTIKDCDEIFFFDNGRIADRGSFNNLYEKNTDFRKMASIS